MYRNSLVKLNVKMIDFIKLSGHGFKMAPVVGKILSQMALGEKVLYDVLPFRLSRFTDYSTRKSSL